MRKIRLKEPLEINKGTYQILLWSVTLVQVSKIFRNEKIRYDWKMYPKLDWDREVDFQVDF